MDNAKNFIMSSAATVLKKQWLLVVVLVLAITATIYVQLVPTLILRSIIDDHFSAGVFEGVWVLGMWYMLASAGGKALEFIKVLVTTIIGQSILLEVRAAMSKRLTKLPMSYFVNTPVGEIMSRLTTDVDAINSLFSAGIINVITDVFKVFGLIISLYVLAPQLIGIIVVAMPVVFVLSNYFRKKIFKLERHIRVCVSDLYIFIQEWLHGIKTVKAYQLEKRGHIKFQTPLRNLQIANRHNNFYSSWFPCAMQAFRAIVIASVLWVSAKNGTPFSLGLSIGTLAAVCDLVGKLFAPIEALAQEFQTIQEAMAGISRINEFTQQPLENRKPVEQEIDESRGIEIEGVEFSYGERTVLDGVNVNLTPGEKAVFVGRSGAGKTTLMNIVAGLYAPSKGTVRICGVDPYTVIPQKRRGLIGIVPQMPQIFDGTIRENITLRDEKIPLDDVIKAAKIVGLHETIERLTKGYDTIIGEGSAGLSSGEVQLLSLARAIVGNPKVLLLDEPTSGMDSKTEAQVFAAVRLASEGRTIFSISHRLSGIIDADCVHVVANGKVVESGPPDVLAGQNGWYSVYKRIEDANWQET